MKDLREARKMAEDAIKAYVASLKKHKEPILSDEAYLASQGLPFCACQI